MTRTTRRWWLPAAASLAGLAGYAALVEPNWIQVTRTRVRVRRLRPGLEGLRLVLLSDLHAGRNTPLAVIRRAARLAMRARPDLIALAGDLVDRTARDVRPVLRALGDLRAPLGVYAVPGNHDHVARVGMEAWHRHVRADPVIVDLTNRWVLRAWEGARVCIAGVDDYYEGRPRLELPPPRERDVTLLLAHGPDQAEQCRRRYDAVDLILSGHTHGGQIRVPGLPALVNLARHRDIYRAGLIERPWTQLYISRGIGTSRLPLRFFSRPEVAVLELTRA